MRIAVQGCCHGELDKIFASVRYIQDTQQTSIDLLIICGDFQAMRNTADLASLACPDKYKHMGTFLPILQRRKDRSCSHTVSHLHVKFAALFEHQDPAIVLPAVSIAAPTELGDMLSKVKNPDEINIDDDDDDDEDDECLVQSSDLAASTTHVYTTCTVSDSMMTNTDSNDQDSAPTPIVAASKPVSTLPILTPTSTKFLALDKCLPGRDFLQIVDVPTDPESTTPLKFYYDEEWLAIVRATHTFFTDSHTQTPLPSDSDVELHIQRELGWIRETLLRSPRVDPKVGYPIPDNFSQTAPVYDPSAPNRGRTDEVYLNRQTVEFCNMLQIPNRINPMGTMVSHTPLSNQDPSNLANLTAVGSVPLI
ncbi:hypothetical protein BASA62_005209 [Batrachochytrium salamandrivorans]|nr:hypothetical protein BASA62_005209 [Batrachochytrium salamandrivorans]